MRLSTRALQLASTASLALGPVLITQGRAVRLNTPVLPEAAGPRNGLSEGAAPTIHLIALGESTIAGVGAATQAEALTAHLAAALSSLTGQAVAWRAEGQIGLTASAARRLLVPNLPPGPADIVVLAFGVNDTLRLKGPGRWAADLVALIAAVREHVGPAPIFLAAVPPMGRFPALPQPLRTALGLRARLLDTTSAELAPRLSRVTHLPTTLPVAPELFCADGFHPGPEGYRRWGRLLAEGIVATR